MLLQSLLSLFFLSVTLLSSLSFFKVMFSTLFFRSSLLSSVSFSSASGFSPPPSLSVCSSRLFFLHLTSSTFSFTCCPLCLLLEASSQKLLSSGSLMPLVLSLIGCFYLSSSSNSVFFSLCVCFCADSRHIFTQKSVLVRCSGNK